MQILHTIGRDFWWDVARQCDYATFFHTPLWHEIAVCTNPRYRDASMGFVLNSGVRVVLPLLRIRQLGPFRYLNSTFENCYGGYIADGSVTLEEERQIYAQLRKWSVLDGRFFENPFHRCAEPPPGMSILEDFTQVIELDDDFEVIFGRLSKDHRTSYRKGVKEGVTVATATSLSEYQTYYAAYQDTIRRWGEDPSSYGYRWELFEIIFRFMQHYPEHIQLWLVKHGENIIGGTLNFSWNIHVVAWHGCAFTEFLALKPYVVMDVEVIRDSLRRGLRYYDLNPSAGMEGLVGYKRRLGSNIYPAIRWAYEQRVYRQSINTIRMLRHRSLRTNHELNG